MAVACLAFVVFSFSLCTPDSELVSASQSGSDRRGAPDVADGAVPGKGSTGDGLVEAMNARIRDALERRMPEVRFREQPLEQFLGFLKDLGDFNLHVQWSVLEDYGVHRDQPVTLNVRNLPMRRILRLALDDCTSGGALTYAIQDGVLVISDREAFRTKLTTRLYDVCDLIDDLAKGGRAATNAARTPSADDARITLSHLITVAIAPDTWASVGGSGHVRIVNDVLVVRQYESVHAEIEEFIGAFADMLAEQEEAAAH